MENLILYVEDNPDDVILVGLAFRKANSSAHLEFLGDGQRAIDYFVSSPRKPLPALLILDLKLPKKSGLEVLTWVRKQTTLKRLPVVMFTSSSQPEDIDQAYDLGANSYLVKPGGIDELVDLVRALDTYWLKANARPGIAFVPVARAVPALAKPFPAIQP